MNRAFYDTVLRFGIVVFDTISNNIIDVGHGPEPMWRYFLGGLNPLKFGFSKIPLGGGTFEEKFHYNKSFSASKSKIPDFLLHWNATGCSHSSFIV